MRNVLAISGICAGVLLVQGQPAGAQVAAAQTAEVASEVADLLAEYDHGWGQERGHGTIAIAAYGPRAGEAVFQALEAAERISTGSIGGIAVLYAITTDGAVHVFSNYGRGGTATLFISGEETGVPPPPGIAEARLAGLVSTGPRGPWSGFYDGPHPWYGDSVGFVIGHRLPDAKGASGLPVDHETFRLMQAGHGARDAVDRVMSANPRIDAGLIAVGADGTIAMHNSELVDERPDYGRARGEDLLSGAIVETIFNEIHPPQAVAQVVVNKALEVMTGSRQPDFQITLRAGLVVEHGRENVVEVNERFEAVRVTTTEPDYLIGGKEAVIPYILSRVLQDGRTIGYTINEPLTELESGRIEKLSTQQEVKLWVKEHPRVCEYETPHRTVCRAL